MASTAAWESSVLGVSSSLGEVNPPVARPDVTAAAGHGQEHGVLRPEKFHTHDRAGQGRVGGPGENGDEAEGGQEGRWDAEQVAEGAAERRADEEQRRHLAALEAGAERYGREHQLPKESPIVHAPRQEGLLDDGDAQPQVVARADQPDQADDDQAAQHGPTGRPRHRLFEQAVQAVRQFAEQQTGQREGEGGEQDGDDEPGGDGGQGEGGVGRMVNAPGGASPVADDAGDETGDEGVVAHAADGEHFEAEHHAGQGGAEDGAEAGADAGHEQDARVRFVQAQQAAEPAGQTAAHLHGRALAAGRAAEQVGADGGQQDGRGHPGGHAGAGLVDLFEQQVVAAFDAFAPVVVAQADQQPGGRQQVEQPGDGLAGRRGPFQAEEEHGGGRAGQDADGRGQKGPLEQVAARPHLLAGVPDKRHSTLLKGSGVVGKFRVLGGVKRGERNAKLPGAFARQESSAPRPIREEGTRAVQANSIAVQR